jgi:hypothetical protein
MHLLVLVLLLTAQGRLSVPGGSIEVPPGCSARGDQLIDSWEGWIECPRPRPRIFILAGMAGPGCKGQPAGQRAIVTVLTQHGHPLRICSKEKQSASQPVRDLIVDMGDSHLTTEVRDAYDAAWLLSIATTFEASK